MARGRFVNKQISDSRDFNLHMSSDLHRVIWLMLIPHLDVEGRFWAEPSMIKAKVLPRRDDVSIEQIRAALDEFEFLGFIMRYIDEAGELVLQAPAFPTHQQGLRKDREPQSSFGAPPEYCGDDDNTTAAECGGDGGGDGGNLPAEVEGQGEVQVQVEVTADPQPPAGGEIDFPELKPRQKHTPDSVRAGIHAALVSNTLRSAPVDHTWRNVRDPRVSQYLSEWCKLFGRSPPHDQKTRKSWISEAYSIMDALDDMGLALDLTRRFATAMGHGDKSCQFDVYSPRSLHKWLLKARDERNRHAEAPAGSQQQWGADGSNPYGGLSAEEFNAAGTRGEQ